MQNVWANVKVMEFQSLCILPCILTLVIILIKPLTTKAHDRRASGDCLCNCLQILTITDKMQLLNVLFQDCILGRSVWTLWHQTYWDIFNFSSATIDRNSTKLDRKQVLIMSLLLSSDGSVNQSCHLGWLWFKTVKWCKRSINHNLKLNWTNKYILFSS